MSSPIFLIGYMASGKTTLGRALAERAEVEFVDLDESIERSEGMSIREIFDCKGEPWFRRLESEAVASIARCAGVGKRLVVACGGGTPCHGSNLDTMLSDGTVVWLDARRDIVLRRLGEADGRRPLVAGKSREELERFVDENFAARERFYSRAHVRFDSSELDTPSQVEHTVSRFIACFGLVPKNVKN